MPVDAITLNPYLGFDTLEPFTRIARGAGRGLFVLVKTSNPGSGDLQDRDVEGEPLFGRVADANGRAALSTPIPVHPSMIGVEQSVQVANRVSGQIVFSESVLDPLFH